jgi:glycosyltransferase involved in cell wall biosynthesis
VDAILATSEVDRGALASEVGGIPIHVVPNGVDTQYFAPGRHGDPALLLFTGAMTYGPNADAMRYFCAEIFPRVQALVPEASLAIVGREPPPWLRRLAGDGIQVTGTVTDVRPWMERAAVFVVPLRMGSGTRLKILEAMASGCAIVSTTIGCEGLDVTHGEDILIADTPVAFAAEVARCLRDPTLRATLGGRARQLVERRYEWGTIGRELGDFYRALADRIRRRGRDRVHAAVGRLA